MHGFLHMGSAFLQPRHPERLDFIWACKAGAIGWNFYLPHTLHLSAKDAKKTDKAVDGCYLTTVLLRSTLLNG
jgi:hypothetical protein